MIETYHNKQTKINSTAPPTINNLFAKATASYPDKIALSLLNKSITYKQLNTLANKLAWQLQENGVDTETPVAICLDRSFEMIIGILAILKAGGAYIPLDPEYPHARLQYLVEDIKAPILLTQTRFKNLLPEFTGTTICLDLKTISSSTYPKTDPTTTTNAGSLAYVIYTSGSTGKPKGVCVTHANVTRLFQSTEHWFNFNSRDVWILFHSFAFDFSVWEIWGALLYGGRLVIVPYDTTRSPDDFLTLVDNEKVTILNQTPSAFYSFAASKLRIEKRVKKLSLRMVVFGGEALNFANLKPWVKIHGDSEPTLINMYGITETTVHVTYRKITSSDVEGNCGSIIGTPIPDLKIHLLNPSMQPVKIGEVGEMFVSGAGLARGYHNRKDLTNERFIVHNDQGTEIRLYKTGDLARYTPDNELEYIGRIDHQVQLRGFRIELGEIEHTLSQHPAINRVVAIVREDQFMDERLIAYLDLKAHRKVSAQELREFLSKKLPQYMIPQHFVILDSFPLTPHGKIDRKSLPLPNPTEISEKKFITPETKTEKSVAELWQKLLDIKKISLDDNFFHLGGHSLLAARLLAKIREIYALEIPFRQFFTNPTIKELADLIDQKPSHNIPLKRPKITPTDRTQTLPQASNQHLLWIQQQLFPDNTAYNIATTINITGKLQLQSLKKALNLISERHEALRTAFTTTEHSTPTQKVIDFTQLNLQVIDLTDLKLSLSSDELTKHLEDEASTAFTLSEKPPLRICLFKIDADHHVLLITIHHIILDAWSQDLFLSELSEIYRADIAQQEPVLPELPIQYIDYVVWQQEQLQSKKLQKQLDYWHENLKKSPILQLPTDHPRPAQFNFKGARIYKPVPQALVKRLIKLANEEQVTLFMLLLSAWYVLLQRYSGQKDIIIGTPITGRTSPEVENLIGYFVNVLPLRITAESSITFTKLLSQVKELTLSAFENQDIPTKHIIEKVAPPHSADRTPLIQNFFIFLEEQKRASHLGDAKINLRPCDYGGAITDISTWFHHAKSGCFLETEYSTDLFQEQTIIRLHDNFITLLENLYDNRELPISHLPLISTKERQQLEKLNQTKTAYPDLASIPELFVEQALARPDKIALSLDNKTLTYARLNTLANKLAGQLQEIGITDGTAVAICMERSFEMIIAILAILKAGGAYVPLDPEYPKARLQYMLTDIKAPILLTQNKFKDIVPEFNGKILCPEIYRLTKSEYPENNPITTHNADSLAYIMYTSGSTGNPKGVEIIHRGVTRLVKNTNYVHLDEKETFLQYAPISFDASTFEIWGPLLNGGKLIICPPGQLTPEELGQIIQENKVSTLWLTAALFHFIMEKCPENLYSVKQLLAGGDVLSPKLVRKALDNIEGIKLINGYGPTENTAFTCCYPMTKNTRFGQTVPIGRPISNTRAYILDKNLQPVPKGVIGELCTSGDGLARGYLNQEKETLKSFVTDPFSDNPEAKLYKTGDLARYLPDGKIEFLGRKDHQVKIRGHRIEIGEIEAVTSQHKEIDQCLVLARDDVSGGKCLVLYYTSKDHDIPTDDLRDFYQTHLPKYMVPQYFIKLDGFPLTPVGKIDRKALPTPDTSSITEKDNYTAPQTATENFLAELWQEILNIKKVGVHDNFFHLGGHSLLAARVLAEIRKHFTLDIPFRQFFQNPTIKTLATYLDQHQNQKPSPRHSPISPVDRKGTLPQTPNQRLLWILQQMLPDTAAYNVVAAIDISGELNIPALKKGIETIISRHESLRTIFPSTNGNPAQEITEAGPVDWEIIELKKLKITPDNQNLTKVLAKKAGKVFNLTKTPPFRARLFEINEDHHILLIIVHHIIFDGWSQELFLTELDEIYRADIEQRKPELPELPVQYIDYAIWQQKQCKTEELQKQLSFWCKKLEKAPTLQMPTDFPRPAQFSFKGARINKPVPQFLTNRLSQMANEEGITLFMLLLSAWFVLLQRYSGQSDIVIGTPVSGRTSEIKNLIGYFVNILPLRITTKAPITFKELLVQIRELALEAFENQDIPTEYIIKESTPPRTADRTPLMQSFFVFHEEQRKTDRIGDTKIKSFPCDYGGTTADISTWFHYAKSGCFLETEYSTDLFQEQTIIRLQNNFITLLENLYDNRELPITNLPLISQKELQQLEDWNKTETTYPENSLVHELIEKRATLIPGETALIDINTSLTFQQLNDQANQLARHLRDLGVKENTFVGICVNRSVNMITIILGILKAGGTYLPLDPEFPKERLAYMLEDTKAPLVITESSLLDRLPEKQTSFLLFNEIKETLSQHSTNNLPSINLQSESPAYIIYTSGSTGKPKGVQVPHRALVNFLDSITKLPGFDENNKMLAVTTLSFDLSIPDVFFPPYIGATTYIASKDEILDGNRLIEVINSQNITILSTTPSTFRILQMYDWPGKDDLAVISIGEPFTDDLKEFLLPRTKEIWNLYGPTETTVWSTGCLIKPEDSIHIGKPLSNAQIFILDEALQQTPIGVPGELYISGAGVTLGYLNRPELNQKHFLPNPFTKNSKNSIIYKTGDLVRYRSDGNIEFLGRRDNQVKVRGFRIELGEIENALDHCSTIKQGIVIVKPDNAGSNQLLAYVTTPKNKALQTETIRRELQEKLPAYMVPSLFTKLESFPMTANGKIDRKSLPLPDTSSTAETNNFTPPQTATEKLIAELWQEILNIKKISLHDNFFHLGGHSLLAVQFVSKLQKRTNIDLPLATLFKAPTIKDLATEIFTHNKNNARQTVTTNQDHITSSQVTSNKPWPSMVIIQAKGNKPPLFLIHALGGNVLNYSVFTDYLGPDQPIYGLQARGLDGITESFHDMESMAKHYASEIRKVQAHGPYFIGGGSFGGSVALEVARKLGKEGQKIALLAMFDTYGPNCKEFEHERKPLYKRVICKSKKIDFDLVKYIYKSLQSRITDFFKNTVCYTHKLLGQPIPHTLRYWYITQQNHKILLDYQSAPYSGEITLFQSSLKKDDIRPEEMQGWVGIAKGEFTIIEIESDHMSFIEDEAFGTQFSICLKTAQERVIAR